MAANGSPEYRAANRERYCSQRQSRIVLAFKFRLASRLPGRLAAAARQAAVPPRDAFTLAQMPPAQLPKTCYNWRMRALLCLVPLAACTGIQQTQVFAGPQRPIAGACDPATQATLTRRGSAVTVSPADGTLTLNGTLSGTTIAAGTTLPGVDKKPYPVTFNGQLSGARIEGTLATPRCRYALTLSRTAD